MSTGAIAPLLPTPPINLTSLTATILAQFSSVVANKTLSAATIIEFLIEAMQLVQGVSGLTSIQKQTLALSVVSQFITSSTLPAQEQQDILLLVNTFGPSIVNGLVSAANGVYNFGKVVEEKVVGCFQKCNIC
jgi:hypothetical protein